MKRETPYVPIAVAVENIADWIISVFTYWLWPICVFAVTLLAHVFVFVVFAMSNMHQRLRWLFARDIFWKLACIIAALGLTLCLFYDPGQSVYMEAELDWKRIEEYNRERAARQALESREFARTLADLYYEEARADGKRHAIEKEMRQDTIQDTIRAAKAAGGDVRVVIQGEEK